MERDREELIIDLLKYTNFIDKITLNINNITKEEVDKFCNKYNLTYKIESNGQWAILQFVDKNGNIVNGEYFTKEREGVNERKRENC